MKKIILLADASSIHTYKWLYSLCEWSDCDVYLITISTPNTRNEIYSLPLKEIINIGNFKINPAGGNWKYLLQLPSLNKEINRINPDVIISLYLTSYGLLGALSKSKAILCSVAIGTDIMVFPQRSILNKLLTKFVLKRTNLIVSVSKSATRMAMSLLDGKKTPILTQQYGIAEEIKEYRQNEKKYTFSSNRAWIPNSNIPFIFDILSKLENFSCAMIGAPASHQFPQTSNFTYFSTIPYEKNISIIASSKFYLSVTSSDGASLSLLEAMFLGAIPIVSNIGPNKEWITHGVNGYLVDLNDIEHSQKIIDEALALTDQQVEDMVAINIKLVEEKGLIKKNTLTFLKELKKVEDNLLAI